MRRFLKVIAFLVVGLLATGSSAVEDLTGPGSPRAALAGARVAPTEPAPHSQRSSQQMTNKERLRRGTRYAMGAN